MRSIITWEIPGNHINTSGHTYFLEGSVGGVSFFMVDLYQSAPLITSAEITKYGNNLTVNHNPKTTNKAIVHAFGVDKFNSFEKSSFDQ